MRTPLFAIVAGAGLLFSAAALADQSQMPSLQTASTSSSKAVICHPIYHQGMVLTHAAECHTQSWWDRVREEHAEALSELQLRAALRSPY